MFMEEIYFYKKLVDWSTLQWGFTIPLLVQQAFYENLGFELKHGEKREIKIHFGDFVFTVKLKNLDFDQEAFAGHTDILQIRYSKNSEIAKFFRTVFVSSYENIKAKRIANKLAGGGSKKQFFADKPEYIALYFSPTVKGELFAECITADEFQEETEIIKGLGEIAFENMVNQVNEEPLPFVLNKKDPNATIIEKTRKIRKLSAAIGESLKELYEFRCQICGCKVGEKYDSNIIHAHHIDYFSKSLNNDANNIMILCPNHHAIIHDKNPKFNKKQKIFTYENGYSEGLKLNLHI